VVAEYELKDLADDSVEIKERIKKSFSESVELTLEMLNS